MTRNNFRGYSVSLIEEIQASTSDAVGVQLARACVRHRVPVATVARRLGVSRFTIYQWFSGIVAIRKSNLPKVLDFIKELEAQ